MNLLEIEGACESARSSRGEREKRREEGVGVGGKGVGERRKARRELTQPIHDVLLSFVERRKRFRVSESGKDEDGIPVRRRTKTYKINWVRDETAEEKPRDKKNKDDNLDGTTRRSTSKT